MLGEARDGLERAGVGIHAEVAAAQIDLAAGSVNDSAEQAVRAVDPVVEAERKAVHASLVVVGDEAGEEFFHHVCATVAVGIFGVNDVGRGADECAFSPCHHAGGKWKSVEKNSGLVETPVAVRVR